MCIFFRREEKLCGVRTELANFGASSIKGSNGASNLAVGRRETRNLPRVCPGQDGGRWVSKGKAHSRK